MRGGSYLLSADIGTEGTKAAVFSINGEILGESYVGYRMNCPRPGWAEQDPDLWWMAFVKTVKDSIKKSKISVEDIEGIGVCAQMLCPVPIDREGELLSHSMILWCDKRSAPQCEKLKKTVDERRLFEITGNVICPAWTAMKILWIKENTPDVYNKAAKFLWPKDYINFKLTNVVSQDWSEACGTYLFDIRKMEYSEEVANELGIDLDKCPEIVPSYKIIGELTREAATELGLKAGTPVVSGGGDFPCSLLSAGLTFHGQACDVSGTAAIMALCVDKPLIDPRLMNIHHVIPSWIAYGIVDAGGGLLTWFKDELGHVESQRAVDRNEPVFKIMDEEAETVEPGSDGLILLPYFIGERTTGSPYARGVLFGLTLSHKRAHIIRALLEGVNYGLRQVLDVADEFGVEVKEIRVVGGGAKSHIWRQIKADIFGKPIIVPSIERGGILGNVILAGAGVGIYKDMIAAVNSIVSPMEKCNPRNEVHKKYNQLYQIYKDLHGLMQPLYERLAKIYI